MADIEMINDAYWLKFAKDQVTGAITARDEAANKLDGFLTVVWGIYTAAFTAAVTFTDVTITAKVIMTLPVIIIPIAKFLCIRVQLPVPVNFYPNVPDSIEQEGYATIIRRKNSMLLLAKWISFLSAISIGLAIFAYKMGNSKAAAPETAENFFVKATYNKACKNIRVEGLAQPNKQVVVSITGSDSTGKTWHYFEINPFKADSKGRFDTMVNSNEAEANFKIFSSWVDEKQQVHIVKN